MRLLMNGPEPVRSRRSQSAKIQVPLYFRIAVVGIDSPRFQVISRAQGLTRAKVCWLAAMAVRERASAANSWAGVESAVIAQAHVRIHRIKGFHEHPRVRRRRWVTWASFP